MSDPGATERINTAIEAAVKDTSWPFQGAARDKLRKKNLPPPPEIVIAYKDMDTDVTIKTFKGAIQTPADGKFVSRVVDGDKVDVSTKWVGKKLVRIYKTGEGQRVNTYSLSGDGKTLTMQVTATSGFTKACVYELKYKRTN